MTNQHAPSATTPTAGYTWAPVKEPPMLRYRPVPGTYLALCMAPGENTPAGLCVLPTQLCSSLPPSSGSRGSPHLNRKYCSTRGATLSTRLIRSPSSKGTAKPAQQEQQQTYMSQGYICSSDLLGVTSASCPSLQHSTSLLQTSRFQTLLCACSALMLPAPAQCHSTKGARPT
jgi:hypothetical protein